MKKYELSITRKPARARNKRRRETGVVGGNSTTIMIGGDGEGGSGGKDPNSHTHKNKYYLDQITTDTDDYLYLTQGHTEGGIQTNKVKSGYADMAHEAYDLTEDSPVRKEFLSRVKDDEAKGEINFRKGIKFGDFVPGLTGNGGSIDGGGNGELQSLILHRFLEVPELRYNRTEVLVGNEWRAKGGGIIESCTPDRDVNGNAMMTGTITLKLEDGEPGAVAADDICMGIFHNLGSPENSKETTDDGRGNFEFAGFMTVYFRVTEVLDAMSSSFRYALRGTSERWTQKHHPCAAMHFVGYGNFTDKSRQTSRYSTTTYERYLMNVNDWEFNAANIAAQFGDLNNLNIFGIQMTGYSAYLNNIYMSGTIHQYEILPWRMEIDTEGDTTLAYGEHLHVSCKVGKGWEDVTDKVQRWTITRDSGFPQDDAAWALRPKVKNFNGTIDLCLDHDVSIDDLGNSDVSTLFTITAEGDDGNKTMGELII